MLTRFPGLKCRVLLLDASGSYQPVSADSVFHTKDHIRVEFESNVLGYVYVLQHGSDSNWEILFPSTEVRDNNNRLQPIRPVQVPREEDFVFDQTPGQERLYIVLALKPEPDLERLLDLVRSRTQVEPRDDANPFIVPGNFQGHGASNFFRGTSKSAGPARRMQYTW